MLLPAAATVSTTSTAQAEPVAPVTAIALTDRTTDSTASRSFTRTEKAVVSPVQGPVAPRPIQAGTPNAQAAVKKLRPVVKKAKPAARTTTQQTRPRVRQVERKVTSRKVDTRQNKRVVKRVVKRGKVRATPVYRGKSSAFGFLYAQVGKGYSRGSSGPSRWDCSGLTSAFYRRFMGKSLPHSSGGQRGMARSLRRGEKPQRGDLVVGPGHVGVYLGGGVMIDAGNSRVGVVKRRLYDGLWIETFRP